MKIIKVIESVLLTISILLCIAMATLLLLFGRAGGRPQEIKEPTVPQFKTEIDFTVYDEIKDEANNTIIQAQYKECEEAVN